MIRRLTVAALLAALVLTAAAGCPSRADKCRANGNTVTTEVERKKVNGKWRSVTEYDCVTPQGEEVDEW